MNYLYAHEYKYRVSRHNDGAVIVVVIPEVMEVKVSLSSITGDLRINSCFRVHGDISVYELEAALSIAKDIENILSTGTTGRDLP